MSGQREFVGPESISALSDLVREFSVHSVFLLHGRSSYHASGIDLRIADVLAGVRCVAWGDFDTNPRESDLKEGVTRFQNSACDGILSIGGGSVMDMGKLVKYFSGVPQGDLNNILDWKPAPPPAIPHIAVPTTSGSGSEATHFAVLYVGEIKRSIANPGLLPEAAIVDSVLTDSLPSDQTAISGMDALSQAIESYWSVNSTEESREYSAQSIRLILPALPEAVHAPNPANREAMAKAAHLAGKAINLTKTTAPHAISYTMTIKYGVPHGHAVALTLGELFAYNAGTTDEDVTDGRGAAFVRDRMVELNTLLGCRTANESRASLESLMATVGLETRLSKLGIVRSDLKTILDGVNTERLQNNPRKLTRSALDRILRNIEDPSSGGS